jgi:hypothetical protein
MPICSSSKRGLASFSLTEVKPERAAGELDEFGYCRLLMLLDLNEAGEEAI